MADYGLEIFDEMGRLVFTPATNAGRILLTTNRTVSATLTVPGLADGQPWYGARFNRPAWPRAYSISISGTTVTLNLPPDGYDWGLYMDNYLHIVIGIL